MRLSTTFITVPQSTSAGGVSACYTHELTSPVTGTVGVETGTMDVHLAYRSRLYQFHLSGAGCPSCEGDPVPNDGVRGGTCASGLRAGLACDGNGPSLPPLDELGTSSFDCPPNPAAQLATLEPGVVTYSTGTQARTLDAASPGCGGVNGRRCFCATCNDAVGEPCMRDADCPPVGGNPGLCGLRCDGGPNQGVLAGIKASVRRPPVRGSAMRRSRTSASTMPAHRSTRPSSARTRHRSATAKASAQRVRSIPFARTTRIAVASRARIAMARRVVRASARASSRPARSATRSL